MKTNTENTVHSLRLQGYKVRVNHIRKLRKSLIPANWKWLKHVKLMDLGISPKGGTTKVEIRHPDGREVVGISKCSDNDSYNRKLGLTIALGRALEQLKDDKIRYDIETPYSVNDAILDAAAALDKYKASIQI